MNIELITQAKIKDKYKIIFQKAEIIKGTVPFWTWSDVFVEEKFGKVFFKALNNKESYFCIDISSPTTDIEKIASCCKKANNYYIYSYKYRSKKVANEKVISLLHSKITYVKTALNHYVIIGSHNNTESAFNGKNMEHSILIEFPIKLTFEDTKLLNDILVQLERIKSLCEKFNLSLIQLYKNEQLPVNEDLSMIVIEIDPNDIGKILPGKNISIISIELFPISNEVEMKILGKKLLVAISDGNKIQKIYTANGEADDKVTKYEMDEKVTDSDFIAIKIKGLQDQLGLPYLTFKIIKNQIVKGRSLNFANHAIHRFKILEEIQSVNLVKEITGINKKIDFYTDINEEDLEKLDISFKEFNINDIVKIDTNKHNFEFIENEREIAKSSEKEFKSEININTDKETERNVKNKLRNIFELIISDVTDLKENKDLYKLKILEILADEKLNVTEFYSDQISDKINSLSNGILKNIETLIKDKKQKNKLKQFGGKYYISN
jgi:hypothetical protein